MSYTISFYPSNIHTVEDAHAFLEEEVSIDEAPFTPEKEAEAERVVAALQRLDPELDVTHYEFDLDRDASPGNIESVELISAEGAIEIILDGDTIEVEIEFATDPETAEQTIARVWSYLEIIKRESGLTIYDPQLDRIVNLSTDRDHVLAAYAAGESDEVDPEKPWWKFW